MAGVKRPSDSGIVIQRKVQEWWNRDKYGCKCDRTNFTVANGNILKFAVQTNFYEFFYFAIDEFNLDINFIDPSDGLTVLDFAKQQLTKKMQYAPDHPNTLGTKKIFDKLQKSGARYAKEIKQN
jgi:hypothetical protein